MRALLLATLILLAGCVGAKPTVSPPGNPEDLLPPVPEFGSIVKVGTAGNEPVVRVAPDGTVYVAALQHVYVSTDAGSTFREVDFRGQIPVYASDSALSVSPEGRAYVAFDWPYAGHTAVCTSDDRGSSWTCNPLAVPGVTDRMWILAPTVNDVYLITGQTLDRPTFAVSHDKGATWTTTYQDLEEMSQGADLAWDPVTQHIVEAATSGNGWGVRSWDADGKFLGFAKQDLATPAETLAVDVGGTWWATACVPGTDPCAPAAAWSRDEGKHWEIQRVPFNANATLMNFIVAGQAGRAALIWYETAAKSSDDPAAEWRVAASQTVDGQHWSTKILTEAPVHKGALCTSIACLGTDRFAGDFLGLAVDGGGDVYASWNRQTGDKPTPVGPWPFEWEQVEFARTHH